MPCPVSDTARRGESTGTFGRHPPNPHSGSRGRCKLAEGDSALPSPTDQQAKRDGRPRTLPASVRIALSRLHTHTATPALSTLSSSAPCACIVYSVCASLGAALRIPCATHNDKVYSGAHAPTPPGPSFNPMLSTSQAQRVALQVEASHRLDSVAIKVAIPDKLPEKGCGRHLVGGGRVDEVEHP